MRVTRFIAIPLIGVMVILGACAGSPPAATTPEPTTPAPEPTKTTPTPTTPEPTSTTPAPTTTVPTTPPRAGQNGFVISDLEVEPDTPEYAEDMKVSVKVTNAGGQQGTYKVVAKLNGQVAVEKEVTLAGGASETVILTVTAPSQDGYAVITVGDQTAKVTVLGR